MLKATLGNNNKDMGASLGHKNSGLSAYEVWLAAGNVGTVEEYLASLKGKDYVPTEEDLEKIARKAAEMVEIPEVPEGIATEQYVKDYAQPKGEYITEAQLEKAVEDAVKDLDVDVDLTDYATKEELGKVEEKIPDQLADLQSDANHRTVTDSEKVSWNKKSDFSGEYEDLTGKPTNLSDFNNDEGFITEKDIPQSLPASDVAEWAKQPTKPTYNASEVGAMPAGTKIPEKTSEIENDSGFITKKDIPQSLPASDVYDWAKQPNQPTYSKSDVGLGNVDNVKQYSKSNPPPYPVTSVNGMTGAVEVEAKGEATHKTSEHNTSEEAHGDIRLLIASLVENVNNLLDSDDATLDQMSEVVAYIKDNRELLESVTTNKVNVTDIIDNLTTSVSNKPLSAKQGVQLKALIDAIKIPTVPTDISAFNNDAGYLTDYASCYGVCDTAADTAAKTVTINKFELKEGAMVIVKFTNANSASSPTLNVNGTGAKPIYRYGTTEASTATTTTGWIAGAVQVFIYDGTGYIRDYWSNTTYTNAGLGQGYGTCSTAAATAAKTVTLSSYSLTANGIVAVKFTNAVPANATMNINSKGAKAIYYRGAKITDGIIKAGDVATFIYSTNYHLVSIDRWQEDIANIANTYATKEELNNLFTESYKQELIQEVVDSIKVEYPEAHIIYGDVGDGNVITLNGEVADGTYTLKYEDSNGKVYEIGTLIVDKNAVTYTNQISVSTDTDGSVFNGTGYQKSKRLNSSGGLSDLSNSNATNPAFVTGFIPLKSGDVVRMENCYIDTTNGDTSSTFGHASYSMKICYYNTNKEYANNEAWTSYTGTTSNYMTDFVMDGNSCKGFTVNYKFTNSNYKYIRFTLAGTAEEAIITINEEIV